MNSRQELKIAKANLLYFQDLIDSHNQHVEEAAQKIANAKKELQTVLDRRDKAPELIRNAIQRITDLEKEPAPVDPRLPKLLALREKLRALEEELR